ncbi:MAG: DUF3520 domain-containing protein [Verrucomicrobia bacterium]|nr:MAG: DUF3520 domain-containing protein [Verrucomicrobiota bacterium]TAE87156.1 MAG: DUF3520 domain-containing protein [Verrucomicrobiota bacterium]TAF24960.1 MAG: DUF3520 domain-containing protein [Verrucomicrobiota bacterium]TAF40713.1 MAG: DUF3520 domain-containing protein [Verrucomicrobiota bacterium]
MNDDTDKPLNTVGDDALEARITAWVLGEASSFEAEELEKLCAADPALRLLERRLRVLHELVSEDFKVGPVAEWKLSDARREKITDLLGVEPEVLGAPKYSGRFGRHVLLALAACLMIGLFSYALTGSLGTSAKVKELGTIVSYSSVPDVPDVRSAEMRKQAEAPSISDANKRYSDRENLELPRGGRLKRVEAMGSDHALPSVDRLAQSGAEVASSASPADIAGEKAEAQEVLAYSDPRRGSATGVSPEEAPAPAGSTTTITSGIRSGDAPITRQSIDAILDESAQQTKQESDRDDTVVFSDTDGMGSLISGVRSPVVNGIVDRSHVAKNEGEAQSSSESIAGGWSGKVIKKDMRDADSPVDAVVDATVEAEDEVHPAARDAVDKPWELSVPSQRKAAAIDPSVATDPVRSNPSFAVDGKSEVDEVRGKLHIAEGKDDLGKFEDAKKTYEEVLRIDPYNEAARRGMEKVATAMIDYYRAAYDHTRAELLAEVDGARETFVTPEKRKESALSLMSEVVSVDEPFSTFSLHVSDASFKLAHAAMERGEVPAAEAIRPEEFYNAFDYGDPAPASGEPVVCVTEQSAHPAFGQRNLLRIGVRTGSQGRGASTPLNLTLLLDHSGSMEREDRSASVSMAVRQLSGLLKEGDTITVAGFSRQPRLLADRLPGARAEELNALIAQTPSEGGTNLEEGIKLGEELAKRQFHAAAQNRVVLFTDGAANLGDARPEALQARIEGLRQQGIAFDAAGFGADGLNDKLLERLTRNGNGRYYVVDGPEDADAGFAKQLAGAFRPAAENVKLQVRFNPARVAKYKLIGFEEHRLKKEDFRNDAVDAAEMAAEEAGNALYQIEVLPQGEGEVGEVSVRFRDVASGRMVECAWTIPYDAQAPAFDRATPSIQLAGLAAFAAEKLRAAPMADAVDFQQLGQVYADVRARYPKSQPVADLGSMIGKLK